MALRPDPDDHHDEKERYPRVKRRERIIETLPAGMTKGQEEARLAMWRRQLEGNKEAAKRGGVALRSAGTMNFIVAGPH